MRLEDVIEVSSWILEVLYCPTVNEPLSLLRINEITLVINDGSISKELHAQDRPDVHEQEE